AEWGYAESWAEDADGNWALTYVDMENGELSTKQDAEADGSATTGQESNVDAKYGYVESVAWAVGNDNWAGTSVEMENGTLSTKQKAEADGGAAAVQDSYIEGDFAWAICEAENADGRVYVDNFVDGNAVLDFEGEALAIDDRVFAAQLSYAEGDFINPWTIAENQYGDTFTNTTVVDGTLYSMSEAIANEDVALSGQYMHAIGTYIYFSMEANNTHQGVQGTFSGEFWNAWVYAEAAGGVNEPGLWMVLDWESGPLGP
ncbi:hypothetical protein C4E22_07480, partial [ANME-1 cluster archaeon AG-394-G06]|nr:hypothetical protein [ANME-1 cluster archaeon AG-394-G06]